MASGTGHGPSQEFHNKSAGKAFVDVIGQEYFGYQLYKVFLEFERFLGRRRGDRRPSSTREDEEVD